MNQPAHDVRRSEANERRIGRLDAINQGFDQCQRGGVTTGTSSWPSQSAAASANSDRPGQIGAGERQGGSSIGTGRLRSGRGRGEMLAAPAREVAGEDTSRAVGGSDSSPGRPPVPLRRWA